MDSLDQSCPKKATTSNQNILLEMRVTSEEMFVNEVSGRLGTAKLRG